MDVMAAKVRIMKMLQEIRGLAEITHRRPQPRKPGLFLIQLRSHVTHTTGARRKQTIAIEMLERPDIPHPVKITHLGPAPVPPVSPTTTATATATVAAS
jgi:hypothetical protein